MIVEHTVLVHVAQLEDALEGLNALGFELLHKDALVRSTSEHRQYSCTVRESLEAYLFREIVEHCSGIEHGFLREEEHLVHIHRGLGRALDARLHFLRGEECQFNCIIVRVYKWRCTVRDYSRGTRS